MENVTPPSADLSKLKNILGNAKNIINKDVKSTKSFNKNQPLPSPRQIEEMEEKEMNFGLNNDQFLTEEQMVNKKGLNQTSNIPNNFDNEISEETIVNSNLPESVKKAFLKHPIKKPKSINHTFNIDDVQELVSKPKINENINNNINGISETKLKEMIKDVLIEYLSNDYNKSLTENTIKKTINTLIKEGKIKTKR